MLSDQTAHIGSCGLLNALRCDEGEHKEVTGDVRNLEFEAANFFDKKEKCCPSSDGDDKLAHQRVR